MKQTSRQAWDNVYLDAAELAVIVPIPEAVLDDAEFDIFGEITPRVNEAIGQRVDSAIIFGVNRPRSMAERYHHPGTSGRQQRSTWIYSGLLQPASGREWRDLQS